MTEIILTTFLTITRDEYRAKEAFEQGFYVNFANF